MSSTIEIYLKKNALYLEYIPYFANAETILQTVQKSGTYCIKHTFSLTPATKIMYNEENQSIRFAIGKVTNEYIHLSKEIFNISIDVFLDINLALSTKYFVLGNNCSVWSKIDNVVSDCIYIDTDDSYKKNFCDEPNHIPESDFKKLIAKFPTIYEQQLYANKQISIAIGDYFKDLDRHVVKYVNYLNKKPSRIGNIDTISQINDTHLNLTIDARDALKDMLDNYESYNEHDWQKQILSVICVLFPKYMYALREVDLGEVDKKKKIPDYIMIDSNGCVDIMEIKQPTGKQIMCSSKYRNNFVPIKLFTDVAVQTTKYIRSLNRNHQKAIDNIFAKLKKTYPKCTLKKEDLKINNPKGIMLFGRSNELNEQMQYDFEMIKRQFKDIHEIMTYDELIKRLDNLIDALSLQK